MRLQERIRLAVILVLPIVAAACSGADNTVNSSTAPVPKQAVTEIAQQIPMALFATDKVTRAAALTSSSQCSTGVDLGDGLSIDCAPYQNGASSWVTGTSTSVRSCSVEFGVNAEPGAGGAYDFSVPSFDSFVRCDDGAFFLDAWGSVTADASGSVQAASGTMSFGNRTCQWNTQTLTLSDPGLGISLNVAFSNGTGSVTHLGRTVATISVAGGCATVNFLDAAIADSTVCAW